jgi:hypothetical protein
MVVEKLMNQFTVGKWQVQLSNRERMEYMDGRRTFIFGIYRVNTVPPVGTLLMPENYTGFRIMVTYLIKKGW